MGMAITVCSSSSSYASASACNALSHAHDLSGRTVRAAGGRGGERAGGGARPGPREWRAASSRDGLRPTSSSSMLVVSERWGNASRTGAAAEWCTDNVPRRSFLTGYGAFRLDRSSALSQEARRHAEWNLFVSWASASTATPSSSQLAPQVVGDSDLLDWDNIGFSLRSTDFMYVRVAGRDGVWGPGELRPYGNIEMSPGAGVVNYGQGVFEGLKANYTEDGRVLLFRPTENGFRMEMSGSRMCMPTIPPDEFVDAVLQTVTANRRWIPPFGKGSLYVRPLLIGTGGLLGLAPAPEYTFLIYVSPVGAYFKGGQLTPIHLKVEESYHRAAPGGTGGVKTISNYAPVLYTQLHAKREGYSDVLYLDAVQNKYVEEVSSCNIFMVKGRQVLTPELGGTILPGITRKSILELAASHGYEVSECQVSVEDLLEADEVFCTGTAVVLSPVGSVTFRDERYSYNDGEVGKVAAELYKALTDLQTGKTADTRGWTVELPPSSAK